MDGGQKTERKHAANGNGANKEQVEIVYDPDTIQRLQAYYFMQKQLQEQNDTSKQDLIQQKKNRFKKETSQEKATRLIQLNSIRDKQAQNIRQMLIGKNAKRTPIKSLYQKSNLTQSTIKQYTPSVDEQYKHQQNMSVSAFDQTLLTDRQPSYSRREASFNQDITDMDDYGAGDDYIMTSRFTRSQSQNPISSKKASVIKEPAPRKYIENQDINGLQKLVSTMGQSNYKRHIMQSIREF